jgi:hypothetical protein
VTGQPDGIKDWRHVEIVSAILQGVIIRRCGDSWTAQSTGTPATRVDGAMADQMVELGFLCVDCDGIARVTALGGECFESYMKETIASALQDIRCGRSSCDDNATAEDNASATPK